MSLWKRLTGPHTQETTEAPVLVVLDSTGHVALVVEGDEAKPFVVVAEQDLEAA